MNETDEKRLNGAIAKAVRGMKPPENLTVTQWADKKRRLSMESSAEPGQWRTSRTPYLKEIMDAFSDTKIRRLVFVSSSQIGKALDADTPIPTPDGWKVMGELLPGDKVFDERGEPCQIVAATGIMKDRPCYRLVFSDGAEIIADAEHLWTVDCRKKNGVEYRETLSTKEMSGGFKYGKRNTYAIQVAEALVCEDADLPFPPYALGIWLGDGNSHSAQVTLHNDDAEIVDYIRQEGITAVVRRKNGNILNVMLEPKVYNSDRKVCIRGHDIGSVGRTKYGVCAECHRQQSKHSQYGFVMDPVIPQRLTGHTTLLRAGVLANKHIPREYLRSSYDQRMALLQGLMDSDGHITKQGRCEITLCDSRLAYDVAELVHTLGLKCTIKTKTAVCANSPGRSASTAYRVSFLAYADMPVFRLRRKLARMISRASSGSAGKPRRLTETTRRRITDIVRVESRPVKCVQVNSASKLYLAGKAMIPTHNSECINNIIGYIIDEDPGSILFIHPTAGDAKEYSKLRIAPMFRDCRTLRGKVADPRSRDSANTILQKTYPGGLITLCGSSEAHSLASKPIRYVIGDERDRWAATAGKEGDPWGLAMARQITFYNSKAVEVSTPTIKGASPIETSFLEGTMERWHIECPHCGGCHDIKFADIRYEYDSEIIHGKKHYTVTEIWHVCPGCGCVSTEQEIRKQPAKWVPGNPNAYKQGVRSFWLNSFVSPWATWESTILEYLRAIGSAAKLQVVYNTRFGELWEDRGNTEDEASVMARREEYPAELPVGVLVLTAGIDTQDDRFEYEIVGHGHFNETWGVEKGIVMGRPDDPEVWKKLDEAVFDRVLKFENGVGLRVSLSFVDEGGHFTQDVRQQCRERIGKNVFAIAGSKEFKAPYTAPPRKQKIVVNKKSTGYCWRYDIGVSAGKRIIMDNLHVQTPGSRYCHFPLRDDYGQAYFKGLLSERLVYKPEKKQPWVWEIIPGHERNEPLDCRNYALAAFKALPADLDAIDRTLKASRGEKVAAPEKREPAPGALKKNLAKRGARRAEKHYDEW